MLFDARAAKLLAPGEHLNITGCPGLRLVATASRKTWTYRHKSPVTGRMKQVAIGQWPAMSPMQAAVAWEAMKTQRRDGVDLIEQKRAARQALRDGAAAAPEVYTVRKLVADYIDGHIESNRKAAGALAARRRLERLLDEEVAFADTPAEAVNRATCFDLLDKRKATPTATQKLRSDMGSAWEYALDAGRIDGNTPNWWRSVMRGRLKSKGKIIGGKHVGKQRRSLRDHELATLLAWLPAMHETAQDAVQLHLWTGTRGVEIFAMRKEHVTKEVDGWWWTVPKAMTKNARFADAVDLRVPLTGRALKIVKRRMAAAADSRPGWLFPDGEGGHYLQHNFSSYVYDIQPYSAKNKKREEDVGLRCPVEGWSPHNLRRTARTLLASLGCPDEIGEAILGHMPDEIVATYNAHTYDKERRVWIAQLAKRLEALAAQAGAPARP